VTRRAPVLRRALLAACAREGLYFADLAGQDG
jgi:hypothetical protein